MSRDWFQFVKWRASVLQARVELGHLGVEDGVEPGLAVHPGDLGVGVALLERRGGMRVHSRWRLQRELTEREDAREQPHLG